MANIEIHLQINVDDFDVPTRDLQEVADILAARASQAIRERFLRGPIRGVEFNWMQSTESVDRHKGTEEGDG